MTGPSFRFQNHPGPISLTGLLASAKPNESKTTRILHCLEFRDFILLKYIVEDVRDNEIMFVFSQCVKLKAHRTSTWDVHWNDS